MSWLYVAIYGCCHCSYANTHTICLLHVYNAHNHVFCGVFCLILYYDAIVQVIAITICSASSASSTHAYVHRQHMMILIIAMIFEGQLHKETQQCSTSTVLCIRPATWLHYVHEIAVPIYCSTQLMRPGICQNVSCDLHSGWLCITSRLAFFQGDVVHWLSYTHAYTWSSDLLSLVWPACTCTTTTVYTQTSGFSTYKIRLAITSSQLKDYSSYKLL